MKQIPELSPMNDITLIFLKLGSDITYPTHAYNLYPSPTSIQQTHLATVYTEWLLGMILDKHLVKKIIGSIFCYSLFPLMSRLLHSEY